MRGGSKGFFWIINGQTFSLGADWRQQIRRKRQKNELPLFFHEKLDCQEKQNSDLMEECGFLLQADDIL
jgi:hypothetical protein